MKIKYKLSIIVITLMVIIIICLSTIMLSESRKSNIKLNIDALAAYG
jgi:hypothetical protein